MRSISFRKTRKSITVEFQHRHKHRLYKVFEDRYVTHLKIPARLAVRCGERKKNFSTTRKKRMRCVKYLRYASLSTPFLRKNRLQQQTAWYCGDFDVTQKLLHSHRQKMNSNIGWTRYNLVQQLCPADMTGHRIWGKRWIIEILHLKCQHLQYAKDALLGIFPIQIDKSIFERSQLF